MTSAPPSQREPAPPVAVANNDRIVGLTILQFFVGGLVLNVAAFWLLAGSATDYDGALSLIAMTLFATVIAVASMIVAMLLGLPVRLIRGLRSRWLANGEVTVIGAVIGLAACIIVLSVGPVHEVTDEYGTYEVRDANTWLLLATWSVFAISVAHFVWPRRWRRKR
ncbi:UNVERIFIED_CONTAM: hypothetical protein OHV15_08005 [Microbacterium sp. SLM126]